MYRYFGMVIYDEVQHMAADSFVRACQMFPAKYRLGLSATPNRKDGKTKLIHWHIGPTLVRGTVLSMAPRVLVRQTGWNIPCTRKLIGNTWQYVPIPHSPARMVLVIKAMASSDIRNFEIVNFVKQAFDKGRVCLILAELRSHLDRLFQMLAGVGIPGEAIGYYVGGMKQFDLDLTKKKAVVLGTYRMAMEGTDVPRWNSLVMATPRVSIEQPLGRVTRFMDDKVTPVVLDLVDSNKIFQNFYLSRLSQYYKIKAEVIKV
jgi:superfamily II DNA or RNA helicase